MSQMLRVVYPDHSNFASNLLNIILDNLISDSTVCKKVRNLALKRLKDSNNHYFRARSGTPYDSEYEIAYTHLGDYGFDNLIINVKNAKEFNFWELFVPKLNIDNQLVQAFVFDTDYWSEQNTDNIDNYNLLFGTNPNLIIIPSYDPEPLPQFKIDVTKNPGRIKFCEGYMETVTSQMWFGQKFFELSKTDHQNLANKLKTSEICEINEINNLLYIHAYHQDFKDLTTANIQTELRELIFNN